MTRTSSLIFAIALFTIAACHQAPAGAPALGARPAALDGPPCMLDDFQSGLHTMPPIASGTDTDREAGSMLGGVREIYFTVDPHPLQQSTGYTMNGAGGLVISSGLKSNWGAYLIYGYDLAGNSIDLDLDLSPYDSIYLHFGSNDQVISGGVEFYKDGVYAVASLWVGPSIGPVSVQIPFAAFNTGSMGPLPWVGVAQVVVRLQSGSPNAGNDFELKAVTLGPCGYPAP